MAEGRCAESSVAVVGMGSQPGAAVHVHGNMVAEAECRSLDTRCSYATEGQERSREKNNRILVPAAAQSGSRDGPEAQSKENKQPVDEACRADGTVVDVP